MTRQSFGGCIAILGSLFITCVMAVVWRALPGPPGTQFKKESPGRRSKVAGQTSVAALAFGLLVDGDGQFIGGQG